MDSVSLIVMDKERYQYLQEHFNQRDNQAHLDKEHNKSIMDTARHMASRDLTHYQPESSGYEHRTFVSGTHGNNTPPRSPQQPSPQIKPPSHHEVEGNEKVSPKALMHFEQDEEAQCMMHAL